MVNILFAHSQGIFMCFVIYDPFWCVVAKGSSLVQKSLFYSDEAGINTQKVVSENQISFMLERLTMELFFYLGN